MALLPKRKGHWERSSPSHKQRAATGLNGSDCELLTLL